METLLHPENASSLWLIFGGLLLALEAFGATGIGFLFAGLAAITAAILTELGVAENFWSQSAWFFALTVAWTALLWIPIKKLKTQKHSAVEQFSNMVGDEATVVEAALMPNQTGKVKWSGTVMTAILDENCHPAQIGEAVIISAVSGTKLTVQTKQETIL